MKYEKNVRMQNCLFQYDLQILCDTFSDKMNNLSFIFKKCD